MANPNLNPETFKKSETRKKEFDQQKSDATSPTTTNTGFMPDDQKKNQTPQINELYEEELPPESRVISHPI